MSTKECAKDRAKACGLVLLGWFLGGLVTAAPATAQVPRLIHYQGYLTSTANQPVVGTQSMVFRLYAAATGGVPLYTETQNVAVAGGVFSAAIGAVTTLTLPFDVPYFLGVSVGADPEMAPRTPVLSSPYALRAATLESTAPVAATQITGTIASGQIADASVSAAKLAPSGCTGGQVLKFNGSTWACGNDVAGTGTVTSVAAGAGISITGTPSVNPTVAIADDGVTTQKILDANVTKGKLSAAGGNAGDVLTTNGMTLQWTAPTPTLTPVINPLGNTITVLDGAGSNGQNTGITLGLDGLPVISYYDTTNTRLKVAKCVNAACSGSSIVSEVDNSADVGQQSSITIGVDGLPVVAYLDVTNSKVKVAKCSSTSCSGTATVTAIDDIPGFATSSPTSITLSADGMPVLSYFDVGFNLKVAKCSTVTCSAFTTNVVDAVGSLGQGNSIVLGADGLPVIAYQNLSTGDLKVAKCVNATCAAGTSTITPVDTVANAGQKASIAIGADGFAVISYFDASPAFDLKVAKCSNAACTSSTLSIVDSINRVGQHSSIIIGADGLPAISYHHFDNHNLRFAKCTNSALKCSTASCIPFARRR